MIGNQRKLLLAGIIVSLAVLAGLYWIATDSSLLFPAKEKSSAEVKPGVASSQVVEAKVDSAEHPEFQKKASEVRQLIPTQEQLQKLTPEEVHFTPKLIQKAALGLGELAQLISDKPELAPEAIKFYRECAETDGNPVAIRASCFASHEQLINKYHLHEESLDVDERIDETVKNLAKKL